MASRRVLEALAAGKEDVEVEDLKAYLITFLDQNTTIVVSKVPPGIRAVIDKHTTDEGVLKPCIWTAKTPWFQELRADLVLSIEELSPEDIAALLEPADPQ